jgi:hypothetical protein
MPNQEDFALVIGIDLYPGMGNLKGAINDAKAFRDWLTDPQGGDVPATNIRMITSEDFPAPANVLEAHPIVDEIESYLREIVTKAGDNRAGRRLYIFMAGHGIQPVATLAQKPVEGALLPANADSRTLRKHAPASEYLHWFRAAGMFDEVVLFMDCCRDLAKNIPQNTVPWDQQVEVNKPSKFVIGLAAQEGTKSRETPKDNVVGGIFTRSLLKGLNPKTGKANARGEITNLTLKDFVHNELTLLKSQGFSTQLPAFDQDDVEGRQIVFGKPGKSSMRSVRIHSMNGIDKADLLDGKRKVIATLDIANGEWTGELEIGFYGLRVLEKTIKMFEVLEVLEEGVIEVGI